MTMETAAPIAAAERATSEALQAADNAQRQAEALQQAGKPSAAAYAEAKRLRLEFYATRENTAKLKAQAEKELKAKQAEAAEADRQAAIAKQQEERFKIEARTDWIRAGRGTLSQFEQAWPEIRAAWQQQKIMATAIGAGAVTPPTRMKF